MSLLNVKRLTRRFIILGLLVIGLVVLPMNPAEKRTYAATPCAECYEAYDACMLDCADEPSGCVDICEFQLNRCVKNCW
jgi:hypothetical protein